MQLFINLVGHSWWFPSLNVLIGNYLNSWAALHSTFLNFFFKYLNIYLFINIAIQINLHITQLIS